MKHLCDNIEKQWTSALAIVNGQHNLPGGMTAICASPYYSTIIQCLLLLEQINKQLFREYPFQHVEHSHDGSTHFALIHFIRLLCMRKRAILCNLTIQLQAMRSREQFQISEYEVVHLAAVLFPQKHLLSSLHW